MVATARRYFQFSQSVIDARVVDCWEMADDFIERVFSPASLGDDSIELAVSPRRLKIAVESAMQDIARYKNYHQSNPWKQKLDCTKRCAYLTKWLNRYKPIVIKGFDTDDDHVDPNVLDMLQITNEMFCLYVFEVHLSEEINKDVALSEGKLYELAYDLLYRDIGPDGWIAIYQLIKDCCVPKAIRAPFLSRL